MAADEAAADLTTIDTADLLERLTVVGSECIDLAAKLDDAQARRFALYLELEARGVTYPVMARAAGVARQVVHRTLQRYHSRGERERRQFHAERITDGRV